MRASASIFAAAALGLLLAAGCSPGGDADGAAPTAEQSAPTPSPAPAPTVPERFRGTWATNATACALSGDDSHLDIGASDVAFHESAGPVTRVEVDGEHVTLILRLSGEGDTWDATYGFRLSDDGRSLVADDGGMTRQRCG